MNSVTISVFPKVVRRRNLLLHFNARIGGLRVSLLWACQKVPDGDNFIAELELTMNKYDSARGEDFSCEVAGGS